MKTEMLHIRINEKEKSKLEERSKKYNFRSISEYIRFLALNDWEIKVKEKDNAIRI